MTDPMNVLRQGLTYGVSLNACQKVVSFTLNQLLVRWTSPAVFGLASIQLELLLSTLLFLSREGVRLALLRETVTTLDQRQRFVNLSWVPALVLCAMSALVLLWQNLNTQSAGAVVAMYCLGALAEALGEPWVNAYQNSSLVAPKMQAETTAVFAKSATTLVTVALWDMGIVGFGIAQIVYGTVYLVVLVGYYQAANFSSCSAAPHMRLVDFFPRIAILDSNDYVGSDREQGNFFGVRALSVALTATSSGLLKHILTEADKIVLSLARSSFDQGIFAVANNYASLVVRIFFLPLEDSARVAFSKFAINLESTRETRQNRQAILESQDLFVLLMRVVGAVGVLFPIFGPSYVSLAVRLCMGSMWQGPEIEKTLKAFCYYIFVLGLNGISEAYYYVIAASATSGFGTLNAGLIASSIVYAIVALLLINNIGTSGIVWAGTAAMIVRIISSLVFISRNIAQRSGVPLIASLLPSQFQAATMLLAASLCHISSIRNVVPGLRLASVVEHLLVGSLAFGTLGLLHRKAIWKTFSRLLINRSKIH